MVGQTILQQLGGGRFVAMTGARGFVGGEYSLAFVLPRFAGLRINRVRITLMANDTYVVQFLRVTKSKCESIATHTDVYAESLRDVFTRATGLATSLGTMGGAR